MSKIAVTIFNILAIGLASSPAKTYRIGSQEIVILEPNGFYEIGPEYKELIKFFESGTASGSRRIATYLDEEDMATVKRKGFPQIKRHLYVLSEKQNEKLSLTLKEFVKGKRYIKDSFGQMSEQAKEGVSEIAGEIFT